ncbi:hypothetical protein NLU13_1307 [Sarocladium strictum]|uniref:Uncharacterized protein n=1 Tax=Sarocladium strictum TaxID=5046 RepID=A0AA39GQQ2_SARSR|nr:hypothetical protein NLU13_1307 [Sarocladium strictum]
MSLRRAGTSFEDPIDLTEDLPRPSQTPIRRSGLAGPHTPMSRRVAPYPTSSVRRHEPISRSESLPSTPRIPTSTDSRSSKKTTSTRQSRKEPLAEGESPKEKRLGYFRTACPQAFYDVYQRAMTQRFYVLERYRVGTPECPQEIVELTGSTGNIYHVHIAKQPKCTCPHAEKGNQCKHVVYVLAKVLNAPFELVYQLALLSTELQQIFENAPPISSPQESRTEDRNRKPIEGDCPICFGELDAEGGESVVWCRAACGQNMHRDCFGMWAKSKVGDATCPFCRAVWEGDKDLVDTKKIDRRRGQWEEGYVNIRDQLPGVTGVRDESTYARWSPYAARRRYRYW